MFRIRALIRHKKLKSRKLEISVLHKSILSSIESNSLNFTEMEKVEILRNVLIDFKALKNKQCAKAIRRADKLAEALKELN